MGLRLLALAILLAATAFGQGRCRDGYVTPGCPLTRELATAPIKPVFAPTGWKTVALDHITFLTPDYRKEAAFYIALIGWTAAAVYLLVRRPAPGAVSRAVAALIAGVSLVDAALIASAGASAPALLALAGFAATVLLQRYIAGT